jgi:C4-dicarboxylate-specific signal transduction histidine kinase
MFHRYRVTSIVTFATIATLGAVVLFLQLRARVEAERDALEFRLRQHALALDDTLRAAVNHVELLEAAATWRLAELASGEPPRDVALELDSDGQHYRQAESRAATGRTHLVWISGKGDPTRLPRGVRSELDVAVGLAPLLRTTRANVPQAAWVYYVSRQGFFALYPRAPEPVLFEPEVYQTAGYREITPQRNPRRSTVWTEAYVDFAEKGLMVTAAKPVYAGDEFLGEVGLDLTLDDFNRLGQVYASRLGTTFLANHRGQLLAHPSLVAPGDSEVKRAADALPASLQSDAAQLLSSSGRARRRGYMVLHVSLQAAPWSLVSVTPEREIWLAQLPTLGVGFVLLIVGLLAMLAVGTLTTQRDLVLPARELLEHIRREAQREAPPDRRIPRAWLPWFEIISATFRRSFRYAEELEARVANRTQALNDRNEQLEQALSDLRAAQQRLVGQARMASLGSLAVGLAHEANTPLGAMRSATDTIARVSRTVGALLPAANVDPEVHKNLEALERLTGTLHEATKRVAGLVASLKGFESLNEDSGGESDLNAEVRRAVAAVRVTAGRSPPSIETHLAATHRVSAPAAEVFRVLLEVLKNARQAVEGRGRIKVSSADEGPMVVAEVEDDGCGIPAERLPHLFDLGFERSGERVRLSMGLNVAYAIVMRYRGTLEIDSAPDAGTRVRVTFPAVGDDVAG